MPGGHLKILKLLFTSKANMEESNSIGPKLRFNWSKTEIQLVQNWDSIGPKLRIRYFLRLLFRGFVDSAGVVFFFNPPKWNLTISTIQRSHTERFGTFSWPWAMCMLPTWEDWKGFSAQWGHSARWGCYMESPPLGISHTKKNTYPLIYLGKSHWQVVMKTRIPLLRAWRKNGWGLDIDIG